MNIKKVQKMAKKMGINTNHVGKTDLIRTIQKAENNIQCYATQRIESCGEVACLWRSDCLSLNNVIQEKQQ